MDEALLEKKPLSELLDENLNDTIKCLATRYLKSFGRGSNCGMISHSDLVSEGYVGASLAYQTFDPNKGTKFSTYAFPYIRNHMMTYCRKFSHSLSISERAARKELANIGGIGVIHFDQLDNEETEFDIPVGSGLNMNMDIADFFFMGFSQFEIELVTDHIMNGYSLQEVAKRHNISKTRAGEILRDLTGRMKERANQYVKDN